MALMGTLTAPAAVLRGSIVDAATGEGLIQASLRVLAAKDSAVVKAAVTNAQGRFSVDVKPGKYIIEASYVGYATQTRSSIWAMPRAPSSPLHLPKAP